jgi:hypothetical protein
MTPMYGRTQPHRRCGSRVLAGAMVCATFLYPRTAWTLGSAGDAPDAPAPTPDDRAATRRDGPHRTFGVSMDLGLPDGAALGVLVRPHFDWLRVGAAVTHNGIAPGARGEITIDPLKVAIAPTLTIDGGHYWQGSIPMVHDSHAVGYNYANFHFGLEAGNRDAFRFFVRAGASWVDVSAPQVAGTMATTGTTLGNASYSGWLAPSAKLGFATYF